MNAKIGDILRAEREKKGLSLHEIGLNLKINSRVLKAIEENDVAHLPAKTFVRGFVRSYAQFLKIDMQEIMNLLDEKPTPNLTATPVSGAGDSASGAGSVSSSPTPVAESKFDSAATTEKEKPTKTKPRPIGNEINGSRLILGLGLVALLAAIVFVLKLIDKYQNESRRTQVQIKSPVDAKPPVLLDKAVEKAVEKTGDTPPIADEAVNHDPEGVENTDGKKAMVSSPAPALTPTPSPTAAPTFAPAVAKAVVTSPTGLPAKNISAPTAEPTRLPPVSSSAGAPASASSSASALNSPAATSGPTSPSPAPTPTPSPVVAEASPSPTPKAPANLKPVEVIVEALNKVDIRYSFGDGNFQTMTLLAEEIHTFKSKHGVQLEVSDGGSVSVIVNGLERGVPGTVGRAVKLSYPK